MRKINISNIKYPKGYATTFDTFDRVACELLWDSLRRFADDGNKVDISNEVSLALSIASRPYCGKTFEVFQVVAEFAKNARLEPDFYCVGNGNMDVWITVKALSEFDGFYIVGFYLSDIWSTISTEQGWDETHSHMFVRKFVEE